MEYSRFSYGDFMREEAYNASSQDCYAFRRGTDERNGIVLSLGNILSVYPFMLYTLLREKKINLLGHLLTFEVAQAA